MSKEMVAILENSLAENEQIRNHQLAALGVLFLAMLCVLWWIGHLAGCGYLLRRSSTGAVYQLHGGQTT